MAKRSMISGSVLAGVPVSVPLGPFTSADDRRCLGQFRTVASPPMTSKLDAISRDLALQLGAESLNIAAVLPTGECLGCNAVLLPSDAPSLQALAFRSLARHLRYCADRADLAARTLEKEIQ